MTRSQHETIRFLILGAAACALLSAPPALAQVTHPDAIDFPPVSSFETPKATRVTLDNGLVVMLLEDHELPLVDVRARVRTGSRLEPAEKIGLADLVGRVQRSGGTESMPSDALDDLLEDRAVRIETWIGPNSGGAFMSCLAEDFPEMLGIFADVLRRPVFEPGKLAVAKNQVRSMIARQNDEVNGIAARELQEVIYGPDSPYARRPTYATIAAVGRDDLVAWHGKYYHPNRVILGLSGDFDVAEAQKLVEKVFGDWPRGPEVDDPEAPYRQQPDPGVFYIEKNDVTQSTIRIGHLGITRDNPDYYAVELMNQVLGGSFAARLPTRVRAQKALAYNVSGGVRSHWDHPGIFQMGLNTKTGSTCAGIDAVIEEAKNMVAEPPTEEEIERARSGILNSFVFRAVNTRQILDQQMTYEYFGYPLDWQERYRKGIEAVTAAEVLAAAKKYIHPDRFSILVVGPKEGRDRPLSDFGEVRTVDITIPEPPAQKPG